jgi:hypothetical protein
MYGNQFLTRQKKNVERTFTSEDERAAFDVFKEKEEK